VFLTKIYSLQDHSDRIGAFIAQNAPKDVLLRNNGSNVATKANYSLSPLQAWINLLRDNINAISCIDEEHDADQDADYVIISNGRYTFGEHFSITVPAELCGSFKKDFRLIFGQNPPIYSYLMSAFFVGWRGMFVEGDEGEPTYKPIGWTLCGAQVSLAE
jgi:hypothetical protein